MLRTSVTALVLCTAFAVQSTVAQVPVVESYGTEVGQPDDGYRPVGAPAGTSGRADASPDPRATELFHQLQVLQGEVQELRGLIEEQGHQLNRLAREQKEQYLDIDRRLNLALKGQASSSAGSASSPAAAPVRGGAARTERDVYTRAFSLTREKRFQEAIDGFNELIVSYPSGQYTPNAFYWLGELYLALPEPELEKSRQSFAQVVNLYPDHQKVPDALYKLGVVYDRLEERAEARVYLARVQSEYPQSPAARLAKSYAAELR